MNISHPWEAPDVARGSGDPPLGYVSDADSDDLAGFAGVDDVGSEGEHTDSPEDELLEYMLQLLMQRTLNARQFCIAFFHIGKLAPSVAQFGFRPDAPSGHYQRHLDTVLEHSTKSDKLYAFAAPSHATGALGRSMRTLYTVPPHEALATEMEDPAAQAQLRTMVAQGNLPRRYFDHHIVARHGTPETPVLPLSMFIDGVPYSINDSVVGIWVQNIATGTRHLCAVLRKRHMCRCGCKGTCTMWPVMSFLAWSFRSLADANLPYQRHDGPFGLADATRSANAGKPIPRGAVLFVKGDWAEYSVSLGFPAWNDGLRPCYACNCSGEGLHDATGVSLVATPWRDNGADDYFEACARCERKIVLTERLHGLMKPLVQYDKRKDGARGLALIAPIPELALRTGDRVEPSAALRDVSMFFELRSFPVEIVVWRQADETLTRRRNPLFDKSIGLTPSESLTEDTLHCLYLGVMHAFCKHLVWRVMMSGIWGLVGTQDESLEAAAMCFGHELAAWYKARSKERPTEKLTRITTHSFLKLIGSPSDRRLRTKGAETWGLLLFLVHVVDRDCARLGGDGPALLEAGRCLVELVTVLDAEPVNMSHLAIQRCLDALKRHMVLTEGIGECRIPKRHQCVHMVLKMPVFGNPRFYANWRDEGDNSTLKRACRELSQATFEQSLLLRMPQLLRPSLQKRKRVAAA